MNDDGLDIPDFLIIPADRRKAAWKDWKPHPHHEVIYIERWREYERQRQDEAKEKTRERIAALRVSRGMDPFYGYE